MTINLKMPDITELKPKITVFGVGGAGGNAVNNMIRSGLEGVEFVCANTDSQALTSSRAERLIQMGVAVTEGLGAGSMPDVGRAAAEEVIDEINDHLAGSHMVFVTAGMGGGTGTGAAPVIARTARSHGILTVGVVTKPFQFEGARRMRVAEAGIKELQESVDTLIVIPNQNLFRIANEKTTFADAFSMADQVLYSGVACITDLMVKEGLINLDFADVRSVMREMGKAMMGTGEASGDRRAILAAEAAIANPLLDETSMHGARGLLISITGGRDLTLFEVDEAATRIREEVDPDANIILGATFEESLEGVIRVSVVATGIDSDVREQETPPSDQRIAEMNQRMKAAAQAAAQPAQRTPSVNTESRAAPAPTFRQPAPAQSYAEQPSARDPGVTIAPMAPQPSMSYAEAELDHEFDMVPQPTQVVDHAPAQHFIPPAAEAPAANRMPRVEDFPVMAQREIAQQRGEEHHEEDRGPMSLLRRLAHVGLGRREEEPQAQQPAPVRVSAPQPARAPQQAPRAPQQQAPAGYQQQRPQQAAPRQQAPAPAPEANYRPRQQELDPHGRVMPREQRHDDDQLEIPAFLRRQAN
ncbi:cell division protein FtsZ [Kaistia dalseonensis]|uniref:Cell division protein FtsZ n=1 Tax=Kaistia dalseonensis TaxID=410840 RepID=A0ABU0HBR9_9HYPH|nr:cell division protein FtsZ [Kaistia dalseonensis]MCX5497132.1 cell division protein FtsZ [Kaistia dalseonensis]MDQ0439759.1 cell division protein FtsZ [Kaistia dalseonensis]